MGSFRRHTVETLVRRARQERTALLLLVGATAIVVAGYAWPRSEMNLVAAADPPGTVSTTSRPEQQDAGRMPRRVADEEVSYAAPDPTILAAFLGFAAAGVGKSVFVPAEIPTDSRLVLRPPTSGESGRVVARRGPVVVLSTQGGYLAFYDAVDGSFTHLPGAPCGTVGERPAIVRRVLGGELVTWDVEGMPHAVFGWGLSRTVTVRVASSMHPMDRVDHAVNVRTGAQHWRRLGE